ncbi:MAG: hypothetical protein QUS14_02245 [Pyrinomonadaceae bacterium]|nr:hypothetical protein [Pyrinomonadaceae bacterium]
MSQKKSQNPILLLTTLGVYIGLLMAGATPGVISQQAALTRNFELSEEFEVRDDLDRDPDAGEIAAADNIDLDRIEVIVKSYLSRVLATPAENVGTPVHFADTLPNEAKVAAAPVALVPEFEPSDVRRSSSFTSHYLARASLC